MIERIGDKDKKTTDEKVKSFLDALEKKVTVLYEASHASTNEADEIKFDDYQKFRNIIGECLSFLVIIEGHLDQLVEPKATALRESFEELTVAIWSILLDGSLRFLKVISMKEFLPLGTRHIFVRELKTLSDAEKILKKNRHRKYLSESVSKRRILAERILMEIIERAPQLLLLEE